MFLLINKYNMDSPAYSLAEIKKALTKHNKELNNDIKVRITPDGLKFTSAKAEEIAMKSEKLETELKDTKKMAMDNLLARDNYKPPAPKAKKPKKKMLAPEPGQPTILDKFAKAKK